MSTQDNTKKLTSINSLCSLLEFSGDGVIGFLNNLLISDLDTFHKNKLYYSALCNPKGRIISSVFLCIKNENSVFLICPHNMASELLQFFTLRKFRLKFTLTEPNSFLLPKDQLSKIVLTQTVNDFYQKLFQYNLPWIDKINTEKFIPQHVNLDQHKDIMSFTKGCYPGQEIIARLKYLGKIKKSMKIVKSNSKTELEQNYKLISPVITFSPNQFQAQALVDIF